MPAASFFTALLPIGLVIIVGFAARRSGLVDDQQVQGVERVTYVVLFPCLLFSSLSTAEFARPGMLALVIALVGVQFVVSAGSWIFFTRSHLDGPSATSGFQGATRFNTYLVFALLFALFGPAGIEAATGPLALMIIIVNLFCVSILLRYGERPKAAVKPSLVREIVTNPLIVACVLGLVVNPLRIAWPASVDTVFEWFSTAAIALGLFAVGAGLKPIAGRASFFAIAMACGINLIIKPALFAGAAIALSIPGELAMIGLVCTIAPTATSAYILARQLGGNAPLMAQIITTATALSALSVTAWLTAWLMAWPWIGTP